jgi:type IV secretory pathway TraG/TraD family ATPase VirD4
MVLGFQGKAQLESLYGHMAEVMLSQPATKIFLKTSEPNAAEWISKAIGEMEIERFRETRTHGQVPRGRNSESEQREIHKEALVMASEISGLDPLHGYLKYGNLVVRMRFPYLELANGQQRFIERRNAAPALVSVPGPALKPEPEPERVKAAPANQEALFFE